jgi:hypothetical protein
MSLPSNIKATHAHNFERKRRAMMSSRLPLIPLARSREHHKKSPVLAYGFSSSPGEAGVTQITKSGAVLFWPALFFIKGDAASAQQVAQLKGDMDPIEQANIQKQCGIEFKRATPG